MPTDIKKAAIALVISCISSLVAVYFDGLEFEEIGYSDPFILGINAIWTLVIAWIIWDLFRGKDIKNTLIIVGAIMLASVGWDVYEFGFGFGVAQQLYVLELAMFITAYIFVTSKVSKSWLMEKSL